MGVSIICSMKIRRNETCVFQKEQQGCLSFNAFMSIFVDSSILFGIVFGMICYRCLMRFWSVSFLVFCGVKHRCFWVMFLDNLLLAAIWALLGVTVGCERRKCVEKGE